MLISRLNSCDISCACQRNVKKYMTIKNMYGKTIKKIDLSCVCVKRKTFFYFCPLTFWEEITCKKLEYGILFYSRTEHEFLDSVFQIFSFRNMSRIYRVPFRVQIKQTIVCFFIQNYVRQSQQIRLFQTQANGSDIHIECSKQ